MKVLLTGATGLIGSHLARQLLDDGAEVHALVRPGASRWRLAGLEARLHLVEGDVRGADALAPALARIRPDTAFHLGWIAEPGKYLAASENLDLLHGSVRLVTLLAEHGCRRFVGAGTCFEYDTAAATPLTETSPLRPRHLYAACKAALGVALEQLGRSGGMSAAWARLFYLHGPTEDARRLVPSVTRALLDGQPARTTAGEQVRDYLHVEDVAAALRAIAAATVEGPVNVGSGAPVTLRAILAILGDATGRPELVQLGAVPYSAQDPMFVCADNRRLVTETGWTPRFSLDAGLRHTVAWLRDHAGAR